MARRETSTRTLIFDTRESAEALEKTTMTTNCNEGDMARRIAAFEDDTDYTKEITCPHCGYEYKDSWELDEGTTECPDCGNSFKIERFVDVIYCTTKVADEE